MLSWWMALCAFISEALAKHCSTLLVKSSSAPGCSGQYIITRRKVAGRPVYRFPNYAASCGLSGPDTLYYHPLYRRWVLSEIIGSGPFLFETSARCAAVTPTNITASWTTRVGGRNADHQKIKITCDLAWWRSDGNVSVPAAAGAAPGRPRPARGTGQSTAPPTAAGPQSTATPRHGPQKQSVRPRQHPSPAPATEATAETARRRRHRHRHQDQDQLRLGHPVTAGAARPRVEAPRHHAAGVGVLAVCGIAAVPVAFVATLSVLARTCRRQGQGQGQGQGATQGQGQGRGRTYQLSDQTWGAEEREKLAQQATGYGQPAVPVDDDDLY